MGGLLEPSDLLLDEDDEGPLWDEEVRLQGPGVAHGDPDVVVPESVEGVDSLHSPAVDALEDVIDPGPSRDFLSDVLNRLSVYEESAKKEVDGLTDHGLVGLGVLVDESQQESAEVGLEVLVQGLHVPT